MLNDVMIPKGDRCPPHGKNRCPYRGYYKVGNYYTHITYCDKYNEVLAQGKTKETQRKCYSCLQNDYVVK